MLEQALDNVLLPTFSPPSATTEPASTLPETATASGLLSDAYTSADFLKLEQTLIFARSWVCVAIATDLPKPGDMLPVTVADIPIALVRGRDGVIRAFHNICSHRGLQLVTKPCNNSSRLHCPYHAWSYNLDGTLRKTPHFGGYGKESYAGFDRNAKNLKPVRVEQWLDLIFINLSGDAPPLAEYLAPVCDRWSDYDFSQLRYGGELRFECNANWKLAVENFSESYHLPGIHPQLNSCSRMEDHYGFNVGENHVGQGSRLYKTGSVNGKKLPTFPNLPTGRSTVAEYISTFPNVMLGVHPDYFLVLTVNPLAPNRSQERLAFYFVGDEALSPELELVRQLPIDLWHKTNKEDIEIIERMQIGRTSPAFDGGCFSPALETTVHHFQQLVTKWMK
jgi:choline monooxygenase